MLCNDLTESTHVDNEKTKTQRLNGVKSDPLLRVHKPLCSAPSFSRRKPMSRSLLSDPALCVQCCCISWSLVASELSGRVFGTEETSSREPCIEALVIRYVASRDPCPDHSASRVTEAIPRQTTGSFGSECETASIGSSSGDVNRFDEKGPVFDEITKDWRTSIFLTGHAARKEVHVCFKVSRKPAFVAWDHGTCMEEMGGAQGNIATDAG